MKTREERFLEIGVEEYRRSRGRDPAWFPRDYDKVYALLETPLGKNLTEEQFRSQIREFFKSPDTFRPIRAGSIAYFATHFDEFPPQNGNGHKKAEKKSCSACNDTGWVEKKREAGKATVTARCQECVGK
jgi:hypothetical protein